VRSDSPQAAEAIELFVYWICRELGSLAAALEGLDALVFTAGIGEHAAEIRRRVCRDGSDCKSMKRPMSSVARELPESTAKLLRG